jgi:type I restriction enzyme R subunit
MITEADTCRKYVLPKLTEAGWDNDPHSFTEQKTFTDGRIVVTGQKIRRQKQKRADYLLRYTCDFMIAVMEAKAAYKSPGDGLQQAKNYAEILGLKFAYSTNDGIVKSRHSRENGNPENSNYLKILDSCLRRND